MHLHQSAHLCCHLHDMGRTFATPRHGLGMSNNLRQGKKKIAR